ncbi:sugar phosphate isomerase/epimerase family protein [Bryobacter aggregatus]|uniref:sugar phosphate isomerase/epimerase family protein n=1 Tax=Bryobacter aggregatus TaxID=360054 RepID=UPI0004E20101|nr:sugar phosphate isomerase/epimerase family protein [Bryobacter aggregatus]
MNELQLPIAAITDEFSPTDLDAALAPMHSIGMTGAELRVVFGKNIMDLSDDELKRATDACAAQGISVIGIASPILKCVLPNGPAVDTRFQQDMFNAKYSIEDQPRLLDRAFQICEITGAKFIRVFSYWRTVNPDACFEAVVEALEGLAKKAEAQGLIIGIENEHACHIGTAAEAQKLLARVQHPNLKLVWDPANALVSGEVPFPDGYKLLPADRIAHVHVKDCHMEGMTPIWGPVGTRDVDWKGQIAALVADGYRGFLSLETHWEGPDNNKMLGSTICGWNMRGLSAG